jgi:hypothetical protein
MEAQYEQVAVCCKPFRLIWFEQELPKF